MNLPSRPSVALLLGIALFWAGLGLAARGYPAEFDARFVTVSSLVYPDRNPGGHGWASAGIVSCGLLGAAWSVALARRRWGSVPAADRLGPAILGAGFATMAAAGVLPERLIAVPKAHETLALTAFISLSIGTVRLSWSTLSRILGRGTRALAAGGVGLALGPLVPIACSGATQLYLALYRPGLPWVTLAWRALGVPAYLSFAFWEWVTCAVFAVYLVLLAIATSPRDPHPRSGAHDSAAVSAPADV